MEGLSSLFAVVAGLLLVAAGAALVLTQMRAPSAAASSPLANLRLGEAIRRRFQSLRRGRPQRPAAPAAPPSTPFAPRPPTAEDSLRPSTRTALDAPEAPPDSFWQRPPDRLIAEEPPAPPDPYRLPDWAIAEEPPALPDRSAAPGPVPMPGAELVPPEERLPPSVPRRGARPPRPTTAWRAAVAAQSAAQSRTVLITLLGIAVTAGLIALVVGLVLRAGDSPAQAAPGSAMLVIADFGDGPGYAASSLGRTTAESVRQGIADALGPAAAPRVPVVAASLVRTGDEAAQAMNRRQAGALLWGTVLGGPGGEISATLTWRALPPADPWVRYGPAGRLLVPPQVLLPGQPIIGIKALTPALVALQDYQAADYDRARVQAEGLPGTVPPSTQDLAAFLRANALVGAGQPAGALPLYAALDGRGWSVPALYNNWGVAATTQGDFAAAQTALQRGIAVAAPGDHAALTRLYTNLGIAALDAGDPGGAQTALDAALAQDPDDAEANWQRGYLAYRGGDGAAAGRYTGRALAADAHNPAIIRQAGLIALMQRQPAQALGYFQQALAIYTAWDTTLRQAEAASVTRADLGEATRTTMRLQGINAERGTSDYYIGLAFADQARGKPPEGFLQSAWRHLTGGQSDAERAIAAFQEAIRLDRDREDVRYQMGVLDRHEGDRTAARDAFAQAKKLQPDAAGPYEQLAEMDLEDKKPDQAVAEFQALLAVNPGYLPAYLELARVYQAQGNAAGAQQAYTQLAGLPARTPQEHYDRAQALAALNRPDEAATEARAAFGGDPGLWQAHLLLAQIYSAAHQDVAALAEYQAVLTLQPDNLDALYESGRLLAAQGQLDQALAEWKRVESLDPQHADVHFALGTLYEQEAGAVRRAGKTQDADALREQAIQEFATAADKGTHALDAYYHLGQLYEQKGDWKNAEARYQQATQQSGGLVEAWQGLVRVLLKQPGRDGDALKAAQAFQTRAPADERAYLLLGDVFLYRQDANAAELQYQQAQKLQPADPAALTGLGQAYHLGGDDGRAEQYFQAALQTQPGNAAALTGLGDLYLAQARFAQAQDAYNHALEGDPNYPPAWTGLGRALDRLQQPGEAVNKLKHAADLDPSAAEPHFYLAEVYSERQAWDLAIPAYTAAAALRPSWALPEYRLGQVYMTQQKVPEAVNAYTRATTLDPNMVEAWFGLGQARRDSGDRGNAITAYQHALKLKGDYAPAWLYLGYTYEENGQRDAAVSAFQNALKSAVDDATIRSAAQEALRRYQ